MSSDALSSRSPAELSDAIGQLHALGGALLRAMFEAIRAYDEAEGWLQDGAGSMAAWISYALGVTTTTAYDYLRVAGALGSLPALSAALGEGRLCYEQVRALVRVATPATEAGLVEQAVGMAATQVEAMVRGLRAVTTDEAAEANLRRSLRLRWVHEDRTMRLYGRFPDVDGMTIATAIERIVEGSDDGRHDPDREPWSARAADALLELTSCSLAPHAEAARAQAVVHVDAEALAQGEEGTATLESGVAVSAETVRRVACDADLLAVVRSAGSQPIGVGRRRRSVPRSLMRLLRHRDGGCRFPSCTRTRWIQAHHKTHWSDGGPTDLDNLVLMCAAHHRFVHEGGWRIEGDPAGHLSFVNPEGRRLRAGPPGLRPEVSRRFEIKPLLPPGSHGPCRIPRATRHIRQRWSCGGSVPTALVPL